jgi:hypothetical protein
MKKAFSVTFILFFVFALQGYAQQSSGQHHGFPGVNQIILQYGEQLNLTDEQKSELLAIQLDRRQTLRQARLRNQRTDRPGMRSQRGTVRDRSERDEQPSQRRSVYTEQVYEILTDQQGQTLRNLLIEQVHNNRELQNLQHQERVTHAGIEGEKADRVLEILNRQNQASADLAIYRIENPGESVRDKMQEFAELRREGLNEMKEFLTVAEFENLQPLISFRSHNRQTPARRFMLRSRRS